MWHPPIPVREKHVWESPSVLAQTASSGERVEPPVQEIVGRASRYTRKVFATLWAPTQPSSRFDRSARREPRQPYYSHRNDATSSALLLPERTGVLAPNHQWLSLLTLPGPDCGSLLALELEYCYSRL